MNVSTSFGDSEHWNRRFQMIASRNLIDSQYSNIATLRVRNKRSQSVAYREKVNDIDENRQS